MGTSTARNVRFSFNAVFSQRELCGSGKPAAEVEKNSREEDQQHQARINRIAEKGYASEFHYGLVPPFPLFLPPPVEHHTHF